MDEPSEEVVNDGRDPASHPKILQNENPAIFTWLFANGGAFLQQYGWFLVLAVVALIYLKHRLGSQVQKISKKVTEIRENATYDPEVIRRQQEQMDEARRRMQEKFSAQAERYKEEQEKKEEEKRQQKIKDWDNHIQGKGYRSKYRPPSDGATSTTTSTSAQGSNNPSTTRRNVYRDNDYNPLMGAGGGSGFRPPRRGGGGMRGGG